MFWGAIQNYVGNIRKDSKSDSGGVLIAAKKHIDIVDFDIVNNDTDSIWAKVIIKGHDPIIIGSYYRRDADSSPEQMANFESVLEKLGIYIQDNPKSTLMIGGDFNFPDINWDVPSVPPCSKRSSLSEKLLEITSDLGLEQMVKIPTRNNNILDLFFY